jgi:hypothetical protein
MGKTNFFLSTLSFNSWAVLATWLHEGIPQKIQNRNLISILNKTSPWAHVESELDVFGDFRKLVKYVVHSSKRKN